MARLASGGRHGLAQSLFQVGGNGGSALGPLLAAFVVVPWGQGSLAWFSVAAVAAMLILFRVGLWYRAHLAERAAKKVVAAASPVSPRRAAFAVGILLCLIFSKYFYLASLTSYYTLYLIDTFGVGVAGRPAAAVRVPRGGRGRDVPRRAGRGYIRLSLITLRELIMYRLQLQILMAIIQLQRIYTSLLTCALPPR